MISNLLKTPCASIKEAELPILSHFTYSNENRVFFVSYLMSERVFPHLARGTEAEIGL